MSLRDSISPSIKHGTPKSSVRWRKYGKEVAALPWPYPMPDQDDEVFIATAHALGAILVTGNITHYPQPSRADVPVMTPREFIDLLRQSLPGRV